MAKHHRFAWRCWTGDKEYRLSKASAYYARVFRSHGDKWCWQTLPNSNDRREQRSGGPTTFEQAKNDAKKAVTI